MAVVETREDALCAEGLGGADRGDDFLGKSTALGNVLQGDLHVGGDVLVHDTASDCNARQDGRHGQGKPPGTDIGEDKTGDEGGEEVDDHGNLLGSTLLYEIWGGGDEIIDGEAEGSGDEEYIRVSVWMRVATSPAPTLSK